MKEKYTGIKGFFKIETKDVNGNILETFEEKNLIVNSARTNFAQIMSGITSASPINKFVIGTRGYVDSGSYQDIVVPKTIVSGLNEDLTELFSETEDEYFYEINFAATSSGNGVRNVLSETDHTNDAETVSTVSVTQIGKNVTYVINIPNSVANNLSGTSYATFTEAGFYAGNTLFNIKTFPAKIKDSSTSITITWVLQF